MSTHANTNRWHTQWMLIRSGTFFWMCATIPLCAPSIALAPSETQDFIFKMSREHFSRIPSRDSASALPVASDRCYVCKNSVLLFPSWTYLTNVTNCWRTETSISSSTRQSKNLDLVLCAKTQSYFSPHGHSLPENEKHFLQCTFPRICKMVETL